MNDTMTDPPGADAPPPPPPPPPAPAIGSTGGSTGGSANGSTNPFAGYRRSSSDRWIAGVAGGLARQLNIDVRIVRLLAVGLGIAGIGLPAYLLAWLLLPADDRASIAEEKSWSHTTVLVVSVLIVAIGFSLAGGFGDHPGRVIPWAIVAVGVWLILRSHDGVKDGVNDGAPAPLDGPARPAESIVGSSSPLPVPPSAALSTQPPRPHVQRARPFLTPLTLALSLIVAGVALLVGNGTWTRPGMVGAIALVMFGVALVGSAFAGRARGLIALGVLIAVPVMIGTAVDGRWGDWRSQWTSTPRSAQQIDERYQRGFGQSTLDLSRVPFVGGAARTIRFEQLAGDMRVVLPHDATIDIVARVAAGQIVVDSTSSGRIERSGTDSALRRTVVTGNGSARVTLDLHLWAGRLHISDSPITQGPR